MINFEVFVSILLIFTLVTRTSPQKESVKRKSIVSLESEQKEEKLMPTGRILCFFP